MATFESRIHALRIEPHPNAGRLELAAVGGFRCIVGKGSFADGDLAACIPEGAVCPDWLIAELGLEGRLAGKRQNRVKAVKLRGVLSQGLVYPVRDGTIRGLAVAEGDDVTALLDLVKYEPPIPIAMQGEVRPAHGATLHYDIENFKKYPDALRPGEPVVITEKLHGSWCCLGRYPDHGPVSHVEGHVRPGACARARRSEPEQPLRACMEGKVTPAPSLLLTSTTAEARTVSDPAGNAKLAKSTQGGRRRRAKDDAAAAPVLAVAIGSRRPERRGWRYAVAG